MKRILSFALCIALCFSTFCVQQAVFAVDSDYEDFSPNETSENLFIYGSGPYAGIYDLMFFGISDSAVSPVDHRYTDKYVTVRGAGEYDGETEVGFALRDNVRANLPGVYVSGDILSEAILQDTSYVVKFYVRNSTEHETKVNFAAMNYGNNLALDYTNEYGTEGMTVTGSDWQVFKATIKLSPFATGISSASSPEFQIGLSPSALVGTGIDISADAAGTELFYLAKETLEDIDIEGETSTVVVGEKATFELVGKNQLDLNYGGNLNADWYVLDEHKTAIVDGFEIIVSDDTKTAEIATSDTKMKPGKYVLVAEDCERGDGSFRKSVEIIVENDDYVEDTGDIELEAKKGDENWTTDTLKIGIVDSLSVKATLPGNSDAFEWYVIDESRTEKIDDFTLETASAEGEIQHITLKATTGAMEGTYYIVAQSASNMRSSLEFKVDKTGDIEIIKQTIAEGDKEKIRDGLEGVYLHILELTESNSAKADIDAFAKVLASSANEEDIANVADLATLRRIMERLAVVSMFNTKPEDVTLFDDEDKFVYEDILKLKDIDTDGITIYAMYGSGLTTQGKEAVQTAITGKNIEKYSDFIKKLKEEIVLKCLMYPNMNGTGYATNLLTEKNIEAIDIDPDKYINLSDKSEFNNSIMTELTIDELKTALESIDTQNGSSDSSSSLVSSGNKSSGGGSFTVKNEKPSVENDSDGHIVPGITVDFEDVPSTHWAYSDIHFLKTLEIVDGVSDGVFAPEEQVTREQFLKLIIEAFNIEMKTTTKSFVDVDKNAWYTPYVATGVEHGIINGIDDITFGAGMAVTRQDVCTMIARALDLIDEENVDLDFTDADEIAEYAKNAVVALTGYSVIVGFPNGNFGPREVCTRAQAAKIISSTMAVMNALGKAGR